MERTFNISQVLGLKIELRGDTYSNKKLQKLLYYVQAWSLVFLDKGLIDEDFQAWVHGPVLPSLYGRLREHAFNSLSVTIPRGFSREDYLQVLIEKEALTPDQLGLIDDVLLQYAGISSMELELLSHSERPWLEARGDTPPHIRCNAVISKESMRLYYRSLL